MEKEHLIIANGFVLTADPASHGGRFDLLLRGGRIAGVAPAGSFARESAADQVIDATGKLIIPGLVNAHFHPESLLLSPLTQGLHFALWAQDSSLRSALAQFLQPAARDDVRRLTLAASFAHVKSGTVAVADFPPAFDEEGMEILAQSAQRADLRSITVLQTWEQISLARSRPAQGKFFISPGPEQDLTVYSLSNVARSSRETGIPLFVHIAEQEEDESTLRKNFQKNAGLVFRDLGILDASTVIAHGNFLRAGDLALCEEAGLTMVLCVRSALMKRTGIPLLRRLAARQIPCALGTDWGSTDMLEEMRFVATLPRISPGFPSFSPLEVLRMGTINGAAALGIAGETGSIEVGKRADLLFLDCDDLRIPVRGVSAGVREHAELLVTHLTSRHVSDVMIGGEFAVREGTLATMTEADLLAGLDVTLSKWYAAPAPAEAPAPPPVEDPGAEKKILPFVLKEPEMGEEGEGFEEGFTVIGPRRGVPKIDQSARRPERPEEPVAPVRLPELPKNVKREFGEDDDA